MAPQFWELPSVIHQVVLRKKLRSPAESILRVHQRNYRENEIKTEITSSETETETSETEIVSSEIENQTGRDHYLNLWGVDLLPVVKTELKERAGEPLPVQPLPEIPDTFRIP